MRKFCVSLYKWQVVNVINILRFNLNYLSFVKNLKEIKKMCKNYTHDFFLFQSKIISIHYDEIILLFKRYYFKCEVNGRKRK